MDSNQPRKTKIALWLILIMAAAVFFRFWQLPEIPSGLYPDVAMNGTNALQALQTHNFKMFYPDNNGREGLFINLIALSFWLFGAGIWSIKVVSAFFGTLTVLGVYFLAKELFSYEIRNSHETTKASADLNAVETISAIENPESSKPFSYIRDNFVLRSNFIALLAAFFVAVSFWHVNFSRIGFRAIMVPFFLVWSLYFLLKGLHATRIYELPANGGQSAAITTKTFPTALVTLYFILAGLFFGLGFHTYIAFRIAPLILLPILIIEIVRYWPRFKALWRQRLSCGGFLKQSYIKDGWWRWDIFVLAIILAVLPLALYFMHNPQDFMGRAGQVSVLSSANPLKTLLISTGKTLGMFNVWGDCNWRHNYACHPELLWPVGLFFLLGLILSIREIFRPQNYRERNWSALTCHWTLFIFFGAMLLPAIMTSEGLPHALRAIGAIPAVFIFAGFGAWWLFDKIKIFAARKNISMFIVYGLLFIVLVLIGYAEYQKYFLDWGLRQEVRDEFTQKYVDEANYLNSLPDNVAKYLLVNEGGVPVPYPDGIPMSAQTIIFLTHETPNIKYLLPDQNSEVMLNKTPAILLPLAPSNEIFSQLQKQFPDGEIENRGSFSVFKIK